MKSLFEPLLHANAKAFAVLFCILFIGMLGWGGYTEYAARRADAKAKEEAARRSDAPLPEFPDAEPIGLLAYVESQTASGTEDAHLPVDLFRCPVDANGNAIRPGAQPVAATPAPAEDVPQEIQDLFVRAQTGGNGGHGNHGGNGGWGGGSQATPPPPRNHELVYNGVFKRTDGSVAAMVTDKGTGEHRFVKDGDEFGGATIAGGDTDKLRLRLSDGTEVDLVRGGDPVVTGQIPQPAGAQARPQGQGGLRRMPTESEIREIEKRDPELAKRIRDAIRRHNERQQKGGR